VSSHSNASGLTAEQENFFEEMPLGDGTKRGNVLAAKSPFVDLK
jgi:hypothetical protein